MPARMAPWRSSIASGCVKVEYTDTGNGFLSKRAMKTEPLGLRRATATTLAAAFAVALTGCYTPQGNPDYTATGALTGGAFGAATGAIIGSASHSGGEGALIGAAAGTIL